MDSTLRQLIIQNEEKERKHSIAEEDDQLTKFLTHGEISEGTEKFLRQWSKKLQINIPSLSGFAELWKARRDFNDDTEKEYANMTLPMPNLLL